MIIDIGENVMTVIVVGLIVIGLVGCTMAENWKKK